MPTQLVAVYQVTEALKQALVSFTSQLSENFCRNLAPWVPLPLHSSSVGWPFQWLRFPKILDNWENSSIMGFFNRACWSVLSGCLSQHPPELSSPVVAQAFRAVWRVWRQL